MSRRRVGGLDLWVEDGGSGAPVLLLCHGMGGTGAFLVAVPAYQVQLVHALWFARFPTGVLPANTVLLATCGR